MFRAFTRHDSLLQNHRSGRLGGWATLWSAEEMLDGQLGGLDVPAHVKAAHDDRPQERLEESSPTSFPTNPVSQGRELNYV